MLEIVMEIFLVSVVLHVLLHEVGDVHKLQATGPLYLPYRPLNIRPPFRNFRNVNVVSVRDLSGRPFPKSNDILRGCGLVKMTKTFS